MKNIFIASVATIISIVIAVFILLFLSSFKGIPIESDEIVYGIFIGGGQMFFPFLIYVIVSNLLLKRIVMRDPGRKEKSFLIHLSVYVCFMIIITVFMSLGDISLSGDNKGFLYYIQEFELFIIFSPIACTVTYFIWQ